MNVFDPLHRSGSPLAQTATALLRINQILNQMQQRSATKHGITPTQMRCLIFLENTRPGACTVTHLTRELGVTQATVSDAVQSLVKKGFLYKCKSPSNRQVSLLSPTNAGHRLYEDLHGWIDEFGEVLTHLSEIDLQVLGLLLGVMVRRLNEAGWGSNPEVCNTCGFFRIDQGPTIEERHWCSLLKIGLSEEVSRKQCPDHSMPAFTGELQSWRRSPL